MKNDISNKDIENIITNVETSLGIKEPMQTDYLFSLVVQGRTKEAIKLIAMQLGLPIDIKITIVPDDYCQLNDQNKFNSTALAKVDESGYSNEGIIAQVTIPVNLPIYNSSSLNNFPINIKLSKNNIRNRVAFVMIMAHEISHVLLYALRHPQKENEFFTDITAMMLGFQDVFYHGRKIENLDSGRVTTYGYLNDNQFNFAFEKMLSIIEKKRANNKDFSFKLKNNKEQLIKYEQIINKFKKIFELLITSNNKNISFEDSKIISSFFQPGYIEKLDLPVKMLSETLSSAQKLANKNTHYTVQRAKQVDMYSKDISKQALKIEENLIYLKSNIKMMRKYLNYKNRIKIFFLFLINKYMR